jgi:ribonuclease HII
MSQREPQAASRLMSRTRATRTVENALRRFGFARLAGVDEVGRGCLAGPVVAGAVVLDPARRITGLCDSKQLTALQRDRLYDLVTARALAWAVGSADAAEIDAVNIREASFRAMRRAIYGLVPLPDFVLVDAFLIPGLPIAQRGIIHGDALCTSIAAASIVAKVTRDRLMLEWHAADPRYGYDKHKGYATAEHLAAVARHGYSPQHRRTFRQPTLFDAFDTMEQPA